MFNSIVELISAIKEYGMSLVLMLLFLMLYIKSNKDTIKLIITVKDENIFISGSYKDAINLLKADVLKELSVSTEKILEILKDNTESNIVITEKLNKLDGTLNKIEFHLVMKRGEDK